MEEALGIECEKCGQREMSVNYARLLKEWLCSKCYKEYLRKNNVEV